jgi:hypothetical protein
MTDAHKPLSAVYVSWGTMKSSLDQLTQGIHSKIDRSVFTGMAWSVQNQLFAGMRFLGLINANSEPTPTLEGLVTGTEDERKEKLKAVLQNRYSELFALDLQKTTPHQLSQKMAEAYNVAGDTRDRAVRFFLSAAEYSGISLSPLFKKSKTGVAAGTRKRRSPSKAKVDTNSVGEIPPQPRSHTTESTGTSKTISLASGGTLTLTASVNVMELSTSDRQLVFEMIDKLKAYPQVSSKDENAPTG